MKQSLTKLYKLMYLSDDLKWIQWVKDVQLSENRRKRAALDGYSPVEIVENKKYEDNVLKLKAKKSIEHEKKYGKKVWDANDLDDIHKGDLVRVAVTPKNIFDKVYSIRFGEESYRVKEIIDSAPPVYVLEGNHKGPYYRQQLSKILPINSEGRKDLYIKSEKKIEGRVSRSGKKSNQKILYLLKSYQRGGPGRYIDETEKKKLEKLNLL